MKVTRVPRKKPRQSRSQATVDVILDAAARIFVETGFATATTNVIAERAGVSVGSLYQYFPNKLALLAALKERHIVQLAAAVREVCTTRCGATLAGDLRAIVDACLGHFAVHGPLVRLFQEELPFQAMGENGETAVEDLMEHFRTVLARHRGVIRVGNLDDAVFYSRAFIGSVMKAAVYERLDDVRSGVIAPELTSTLLLYLTGHPQGLTVPATVS